MVHLQMLRVSKLLLLFFVQTAMMSSQDDLIKYSKCKQVFKFLDPLSDDVTNSSIIIAPLLVSEEPLIKEVVEVKEGYTSLCDEHLRTFDVSSQKNIATISVNFFGFEDLLCNVLSLLNLEDLINFNLLCKSCYNYCNTFIQKSLSRLNIQITHCDNSIPRIHKMILVSEFSELYKQAFPPLIGKKIKWLDMTGLLAIALNSIASNTNVTKTTYLQKKFILLYILNIFPDFTDDILKFQKELKTISKPRLYFYTTIALVRSIEAGRSSFYNNQNNFNAILAHSMVSQHETLMKYLIEHGEKVNIEKIVQSISECPRLNISVLLHKSLENSPNRREILLRALENAFIYNNLNLFNDILKNFSTAFNPIFQNLFELIGIQVFEPELDSAEYDYDLFRHFCQIIRSQRVLLGAEYHENTHFTKYEAEPSVNVKLFQFDNLIFGLFSNFVEHVNNENGNLLALPLALGLTSHFPNFCYRRNEKTVFSILSFSSSTPECSYFQNKLNIPDFLKYFNLDTTLNSETVGYIILFTNDIQIEIFNFISYQIKHQRISLGAQYDVDVDIIKGVELLRLNAYDRQLLNLFVATIKINQSIAMMILKHICKRPIDDFFLEIFQNFVPISSKYFTEFFGFFNSNEYFNYVISKFIFEVDPMNLEHCFFIPLTHLTEEEAQIYLNTLSNVIKVRRESLGGVYRRSASGDDVAVYSKRNYENDLSDPLTALDFKIILIFKDILRMTEIFKYTSSISIPAIMQHAIMAMFRHIPDYLSGATLDTFILQSDFQILVNLFHGKIDVPEYVYIFETVECLMIPSFSLQAIKNHMHTARSPDREYNILKIKLASLFKISKWFIPELQTRFLTIISDQIRKYRTHFGAKYCLSSVTGQYVTEFQDRNFDDSTRKQSKLEAIESAIMDLIWYMTDFETIEIFLNHIPNLNIVTDHTAILAILAELNPIPFGKLHRVEYLKYFEPFLNIIPAETWNYKCYLIALALFTTEIQLDIISRFISKYPNSKNILIHATLLYRFSEKVFNLLVENGAKIILLSQEDFDEIPESTKKSSLIISNFHHLTVEFLNNSDHHLTVYTDKKIFLIYNESMFVNEGNRRICKESNFLSDLINITDIPLKCSPLKSAFDNYSSNVSKKILGCSTFDKEIHHLLAYFLALNPQRYFNKEFPKVRELVSVQDAISRFCNGKPEIVTIVIISELIKDPSSSCEYEYEYDFKEVFESFVKNMDKDIDIQREMESEYVEVFKDSAMQMVRTAIRFDLPNQLFLILLDGYRSKLKKDIFSRLIDYAYISAFKYKVLYKLELLRSYQQQFYPKKDLNKIANRQLGHQYIECP